MFFCFLFYFIISIMSNSKKNHEGLLGRTKKENYKIESIMSKGQTSNNGPWGTIGTDRPWYEYPYTLHNIEY